MTNEELKLVSTQQRGNTRRLPVLASASCAVIRLCWPARKRKGDQVGSKFSVCADRTPMFCCMPHVLWTCKHGALRQSFRRRIYAPIIDEHERVWELLGPSPFL